MKDLSDEHKDNPGLAARVGRLETQMAAVRTDITWIKALVTPTFLISLVSLLLLIASIVSQMPHWAVAS